ncbi:MAG TPA: PQQ-binding-like beta-propeller repeat protein [Thermoanaerobaculia bacterium]|jgi:outer membrane protein assembly factor BamB|nr:PQQ-binding-like beta-propeller repeat protein [Thermoanaerobaculia bacterium]
MAKTSGPLYIGLGGHVLAIDRATGAEIWRCKLRSSSFVTIAVEPDAIYAGANGELFCIDPATGSIRWHNKLKGLGISVVAFSGGGTTSAAAAIRAAQAAAAT